MYGATPTGTYERFYNCAEWTERLLVDIKYKRFEGVSLKWCQDVGAWTVLPSGDKYFPESLDAWFEAALLPYVHSKLVEYETCDGTSTDIIGYMVERSSLLDLHASVHTHAPSHDLVASANDITYEDVMKAVDSITEPPTYSLRDPELATFYGKDYIVLSKKDVAALILAFLKHTALHEMRRRSDVTPCPRTKGYMIPRDTAITRPVVEGLLYAYAIRPDVIKCRLFNSKAYGNLIALTESVHFLDAWNISKALMPSFSFLDGTEHLTRLATVDATGGISSSSPPSPGSEASAAESSPQPPAVSVYESLLDRSVRTSALQVRSLAEFALLRTFPFHTDLASRLMADVMKLDCQAGLVEDLRTLADVATLKQQLAGDDAAQVDGNKRAREVTRHIVGRLRTMGVVNLPLDVVDILCTAMCTHLPKPTPRVSSLCASVRQWLEELGVQQRRFGYSLGTATSGCVDPIDARDVGENKVLDLVFGCITNRIQNFSASVPWEAGEQARNSIVDPF